ncbi:MAG: hypothetical protein QXH53_03790, partial [Nitrososphaerales archaeon]
MRIFIKRSHVSIWRWIQDLAPLEKFFKPKRVHYFLVDETMVKVKGLEGWVWVAYEPYQHRFLALSFSLMRSILTAELFLKKL